MLHSTKPILLAILISLSGFIQTNPARTLHPPQPRATPPSHAAANQIRAESLHSHLKFLASDRLDSRVTPSPGLDAAANYIEEQLKRWRVAPAGVQGSYFQFVNMYSPPQVPPRNIAAIIEGGDPILKDEYVVLMAHYDHGRFEGGTRGDRIWNGADDNASGVVGLLAIAEAMARTADRPKRSLLFLWHCGEESDFLGACYHANSPLVPLNKINALINFDMIGRTKDADPENMYLTTENEIYVLGAGVESSTLRTLVQRVRDEYPTRMDYVYGYRGRLAKPLYKRSDHIVYYQRRIPSIFFTSGLHRNYHKPSDEVDKIDCHKIAKVAQMALVTSWAMADLATQLPRAIPDSRFEPCSKLKAYQTKSSSGSR